VITNKFRIKLWPCISGISPQYSGKSLSKTTNNLKIFEPYTTERFGSLRDLRLSQWCCWIYKYFGIWRRIDWQVTDVSETRPVSVFRVYQCKLYKVFTGCDLSWLPVQHLKLYFKKYKGADKSLARPTSRCILFNGESISFDAILVIYK
jgi:hypothetical protein